MVENKRKELSIHPRSWATGDGKIKNTAEPATGGRVRKKVMARAMRRENDWEATLKMKPGFRKPGSRNPSKLRQR